jgi:predicted GTPase
VDISGDLQCQAILNGLRDLESVLDGPLASKALDLTENATTSRQKDLLIRLKKSLEQYVERTGDLVYIALIGHFSSGKSSTINSLLNLWGKPSQRDVDLNPTDKAITLITHEKNATSLLGVVNQGSVPIKMQPIESELLSGMVLADTPGTGDPHLVEELARDFLPICDLVLFFFSAASPLDSTDIPLLMELHRRLPFIPLRFVITRADELRSDPHQPISNSNFDVGKAAAFIADVMSRITLLLKPSKYSDKDFLLIDNKAQFNVDVLRSDLLNRADPANLSSRITMHSHKVKFFQTTAESLRQFFASFVEAKLNELNRVVSTGEKNIQKYHEAVSIANSNLTKSWFDQHNALQELKSKATERTKSLSELPASVFDFEPASKLFSEIRSDITRQTSSVAEQIQQQVTQSGLEQLKRHLSQVRRAVATADLDSMSPQDHGLSPITIEWTFGDTEIIQVNYLARKVDDARHKLSTLVLGIATDTRRFLEDIQRTIQHRQVIGKCEEIVSDAQISLARDLDVYFQSVQVYRTGVIAMTSMSSIAKLGISEELDQIETEFTDEDKESIKLTTKQSLFPSFDDVLAAATTKLAGISERIRSILSGSGSIQFEQPPSALARIELAASEKLLAFISEVKDELQRETNEFITGLQAKLAGVIATVRDDYDKDRTAAQRAREVRYVKMGAVTGLITVIAYIIYHWINHPVGQSVPAVLVWGVLANLIGDAIGLGVAWFRDTYPETKRQIKERHAAVLHSQINTTINEALKAHQFSVLQVPTLGKKLEKIYSTLISPLGDAWQATVEEQYRDVRSWISSYQEIRRSYLAVVEGFAKDCGRYFEDAEQNLATLKSAAHSIQERAIEPSFVLLARTSDQLQQVKNEINMIGFD